MRNIYIDSSAILKFIIKEAESEAVVSISRARFITSELSRVEVKRAILRYEPSAIKVAENILDNFNYVKIDSQTLVQAERLPERINLRALDAIHIAVASKMALKINSILTYDKHMAKAAKALGFEVLSPTKPEEGF
jgi:predicted nucleic acid-binding protein